MYCALKRPRFEWMSFKKREREKDLNANARNIQGI